MKLLIDNDVVLDYLTDRESFAKQASALFALIEQKRVQAFLSASSWDDLIYVHRKPSSGLTEVEAQAVVRELHRLISVAPVDQAIIDRAFVLEGTSKNSHFFVSARKHRAHNRGV
ncbi:MAG: hypothetical protein GKR94_28245 [Gammaproteobacteria bacterium]|nr:hypothetical protein [Gammaproteobacteria bacterium]